jgi:hypothetical protein
MKDLEGSHHVLTEILSSYKSGGTRKTSVRIADFEIETQTEHLLKTNLDH